MTISWTKPVGACILAVIGLTFWDFTMFESLSLGVLVLIFWEIQDINDALAVKDEEVKN